MGTGAAFRLQYQYRMKGSAGQPINWQFGLLDRIVVADDTRLRDV